MRFEGWLTAAMLMCGCELAFNPSHIPFPSDGGGGGHPDAGMGGGMGGGGGGGMPACTLSNLVTGHTAAPNPVTLERSGPDATLHFLPVVGAKAYHVLAEGLLDAAAPIEGIYAGPPVRVHGLALGTHYLFTVSTVDVGCADGPTLQVSGGVAGAGLSDAGLKGGDGGMLLPTPAAADGLYVGRLDADRLLDALVVHSTTTGVARFKGNGTTFDPVATMGGLPVSAPQFHLPASDFDGDGIDDFALFELHMMPLQPMTQLMFAPQPLTPMATDPLTLRTCSVTGNVESMTAIDLKGAGRSELAVLTRDVDAGVDNGPTWVSLVSMGTGGSCVPGARTPVPLKADGISAGDFDGDGRADLAFTVYAPLEKVLFWFGDGDGGFPRTGELMPLQEGASVLAGYFQADAGRGVVIDGFGSFVYYLVTDAGFTRKPSTTYPVGGGHTRLIAADLDGDGVSELLSGSTNDGGSGTDAERLMMWRGPIGPSGFTYGALPGRPTYAVEVADVDGDNRLDVVTLERESALSGLRVRKGTPTP